MRKIALLGMLVLALTASMMAAEMTADELIAKYIAAVGGETNLRAVKSLMMKGSMMTQGMTLDAKLINVLPDKAYMEMAMNGSVMQVVGTNGKDAWVKGPMGTFFLTGDQKISAMKQSKVFPLLDYKKNGASVKFLGEDMVKGTKAYKLQFVGTDKDTTVYYFDSTTFYNVKEKSVQATTSMSDFRKVGNLNLPYKINAQSGQGQMMITFDTIAVNSTIPDSLFVMPKDAKPMPDMSKPAAPPDSAAGKK
jgi:outer membrane lipoprotein-sorting protein